MGTNIDGNRKVMFAMTAIKGVGRRYANIVLKKADIDLDKRAGECSEEEVSYRENITIMSFIFNIYIYFNYLQYVIYLTCWIALGRKNCHHNGQS